MESLEEDIVVDISQAREKFFGCSGKMLIPCKATVAAQVEKIPGNRLMTMDLLRKVLADQFQVQVTCPYATKIALRAIANDPANEIAYWRIIRKNGELIAYFPGGIDGHAALLKSEGFTIEINGKTQKVKDYSGSLYHPV